MVFIYHRLFKPRLYDFEMIPRFVRNIMYKVKTRFFPAITVTKEPNQPHMITAYPGPRMKNLLNDLEMSSQDYLNAQNFLQHEKCIGNYIVDSDNNTYLDLYTNIGSLPLGYNHPKLVEMSHQDEYAMQFINKLDMNHYYTPQMQNLIETTVKHIQPKKLHHVIFTCGCGSSCNELAIKIAMLRRGNTEGVNNVQNVRQMDLNKVANDSKLSVLSFKHGFHGRIGGTLTLTRSKAIQKVGIPQFDWPVAPFPVFKHPLKDNEASNLIEENICIEEIENVMKSNPNICALMVEPIQAEGGDFWGTNTFFRRLRQLATKYNITFIVDEVQTGMSTGRMWAHELWDLETPPDMVTFAKKFQVSGLFLHKDVIPKNLSTDFCGDNCFDLFRLSNLSKILNVVEKNNLFEKSVKTTETFKNNFRTVSSKNLKTPIFTNIRGKGNFVAFDLENSKIRDLFVKFARNNGVFLAGCGDASIRLRPTLLIEDKHYQHLLDLVEEFPNSIAYKKITEPEYQH